MNKKRIKLMLSVVAMALLLTGCSNVVNPITLETTFKEEMSNGFFSALFVYPMAQAINWLEPKVGIALAVAILTVAINIVIIAFTFKSTVGMQRMQEIQPEMQKIQAKYEGRQDQMSQQRMAMEMQQLYSKYDINPLTTLVITFIQFPILIGMYNAVRRSSAVSNAIFMGVHLSATPSEAFLDKKWVCVVIFALMVIFQFLSIKTPQWLADYHGKKKADAHHKTYQKPEQQNVFMTYGMLAMVALAMWSCPTALSLYYCIYSLVNIIKTLIIDKITHKGEE